MFDITLKIRREKLGDVGTLTLHNINNSIIETTLSYDSGIQIKYTTEIKKESIVKATTKENKMLIKASKLIIEPEEDYKIYKVYMGKLFLGEIYFSDMFDLKDIMFDN